jgi:hypothetical protein
MTTRTFDPTTPISGHVFLYEGKRRSTWVAKWRDQSGQHEKRLGPAWMGKGPPLREISPLVYVQALTGLTPGRDGKVSCPFHGADRTPSPPTAGRRSITA